MNNQASSPTIEQNIAWRLQDRAIARGFATQRAYFCEDQGPTTHLQIHERGARAASALASLGVGPGSRVALRAPDSTAWIAAFLGCARLGALVGIMNPNLTPEAARGVLDHFGPDLELGTGHRAMSLDAVEELAADRHPMESIAVGSNTPLYVQYTSGTTGAPRGAVHTHAHIEAYGSAFGSNILGLSADDVCLSASRMFFAYGFVNSVALPLYSGASAVLSVSGPTPSKIAERVHEHGVTALFAVPSYYVGLTSITDQAAYRTVRVGVSGGERLNLTARSAASELLGAPLLDCLGSTEMGYTYCANRLSDLVAGTAGRPLDGYHIQLRADGKVIDDDETEGDLWVLGPSTMPGYLDGPEETSEVLKAGWLWTKDRAVRVGGHYSIRGRADDVEIVNGMKVNPSDIEAVLSGSDGVIDLAVVGEVDSAGSSLLHAYVVAKTNERDKAVDAVKTTARSAFTREPHKIPRLVTIIDELPRTPTGKLQRFAVRRLAGDQDP